MTRSRSLRPRTIVFAVLTLFALHCKKRPTELEQLGVTEQEAQQILREIAAARSATPAQEPVLQGQPQAAQESPALTAADQPSLPEPALENDRWVIDDLVDVAPAGPSRAHATGVLLVTDQNRLLHAPLGPLPKGKPSPPNAASVPSPIASLPDGAGTFRLARGPCFSKTHAYWVASHFLYRQALGKPDAPVETLAEDARVATRCSAVTVNTPAGERDWVAYIALPTEAGGPLLAKLWYGSKATLTLTPEGSSSLSIQLTQVQNRAFAYSLEGRTGMSSLHARELGFNGDTPNPLEDKIIWVGGGAVSTTELALATGPASETDAPEVYGLLPIERDSSTFGLAILQLSTLAKDTPAPITWAIYPNGMEHAPTDSAIVGNALTVLFARPATAAPRSPQELVLAELNTGALTNEQVLSRSKAFFDVSIAAITDGALISYVADYRTWARTLRCAR